MYTPRLAKRRSSSARDTRLFYNHPVLSYTYVDPNLKEHFADLKGDDPVLDIEQDNSIGFERTSGTGVPLPTLSFTATVITKPAKTCGFVPNMDPQWLSLIPPLRPLEVAQQGPQLGRPCSPVGPRLGPQVAPHGVPMGASIGPCH